MRRNPVIKGHMAYLTVLGETDPPEHVINKLVCYAKCVCDCGTKFVARWYDICKSKTQSCGCLNEKLKKERITHGLSKHPLYSIYLGMIDRCEKSTRSRYDDYGGRGIKVCSLWRKDFKNFYNWAIANGWRKHLTIERIDNDKGYNPKNCKIATYTEQANNKCNNVYYQYKDELLTIPEISRLCGIKASIIYKRIYKGWTLTDASTIKPDRSNRIYRSV